jgi:hypothetical protein
MSMAIEREILEFNGGNNLTAAIPERPAGINAWQFGDTLLRDAFKNVSSNRLMSEITKMMGNMNPGNVQSTDNLVAVTTANARGTSNTPTI